ncbi:MAG: response regulator [Magnetococcus sp. YQC-5]
MEDDPTASMVTVNFFNSQGIKVQAVGDPNEALRLLKKELFICIVLDLDLPGMSGFELLERIATDKTLARPPVIVYSGRELSREEYRRLRNYTDSVIMKGSDSGERLLSEVNLFLHDVEKEPSLIEPLPKGKTLFSGEKIMLVDDDMRNLFAMSKILQSQGLRVLLAPDGRRSLELLEKTPDVRMVLMDVMMPVMDGLEAIRQIRSHTAFQKLPIIILSAKAMAEDQEKGLSAGANAFLSKPVDMDQLITVMRKYLSV